MTATLVLKGWENVQANLRRLADEYPEALGYGLREEGMAVMDESLTQCPVDQLNPHDDGTPHLADTHQVIGPEFDGGNITVTLSYGNPTDPTGIYAVIQHENMDFHHTTPGTKAKYLEDPLTARAPFIGPNLARAVNIERMGGGYQAQATAGILEHQGDMNRMQRGINQYGHLLGRFV